MADGGASRGALAALAHAKAMKDQTDPAIWFDSWDNDLRDNDMDGRIDADDRGELRFAGADGQHYTGTYQARVAPYGLGRVSTRHVPDWMLHTIRVTYKVCVDIPIESYRAARVPMPACPKRQVGELFAGLKARAAAGWRVWEGTPPDELLDGDIVAANHVKHPHSGIVEIGTTGAWVINLPGPSSAQLVPLAYAPSGGNDMVSVPFVLFNQIKPVDLVARWTGP
jgi:hypothetical protein